MKLYRYLEIPNLTALQDKLFDLIPKDLFLHPRVFFPDDQNIFREVTELTDFLYSLNLDPADTVFAFYIVGPNTSGIIHCDYGNQDYSINIPIKNCVGTFVKFYTSPTPLLLKEARIENGVEYKPHYYINPSDCVCTKTVETGTPYIMNIKNIHNVENPNYKFRINLLCRSNNNQAMSAILNGSE